jgi:hypothetical protein
MNIKNEVMLNHICGSILHTGDSGFFQLKKEWELWESDYEKMQCILQN